MSAATNKIPTRQLGRNGPSVPPLGFGLMGLSHGTYGAIPNDEEAFKILDRAYEQGNRFWDSADLYGDSESLIGRWFKRTGHRGEIFLATKFGFVKGGKGFHVDSSYEYCKKACAESLYLLDIDCIDLCNAQGSPGTMFPADVVVDYVHSVNLETPIEETMRALADLQAEGKIRHIGLSAISSSTLRRAVKIAPVACVQTDYSPFELSIEGPAGTDLLATCRELGIAVVAAMPLGRGMITSKFAAGAGVGDSTDVRPKAMPRFMAENRETNVHVVNQFKTFADRKGCSTAQLALAWLSKQGDDIIPIPGTKQMKYLEENWAALSVELSDEEAADLRSFLEKAEVVGDTLPAAFKGFSFKDTVKEA